MPNIYVNVDIDEFMWSCSDSEKQELVNTLKEEGFIKPEDVSKTMIQNSPDEEWLLVLKRLTPNRFRLTNEEEAMITEISKRFL